MKHLLGRIINAGLHRFDLHITRKLFFESIVEERENLARKHKVLIKDLHISKMHLKQDEGLLKKKLNNILGNVSALHEDQKNRLLFLKCQFKNYPNLPIGNKCILCNNKSRIIGKRYAMIDWDPPNKEIFNRNICYCIDCGIYFIDPMYSPEDIKLLYNSNYQPGDHKIPDDDHELNEYINRANIRIQNVIKYLSKFDEISALIKAKDKKSILEIGCYDGMLLKYFQDLGHNVSGVEISSEGVGISKKILGSNATMYHQNFEEVEIKTQYDFIFAMHIIEHVRDPISFLKKCSMLLNDDGIIIVETPITEQLEDIYFSRFRDENHTFFFTVRSFSKVADHSNLFIKDFTQIQYVQPPHGSHTNAGIMVLSNNSDEAYNNNLNKLIDLYEDSCRNQIVLAMMNLHKSPITLPEIKNPF